MPRSIPLYFEQNVGQADAQVRFLSRGAGYSVFLTRSGPVFSLTGKSHAQVACKSASCAQDARQPNAVRMAFANANPDPVTEGMDQQPGRSHYFIGNDRAKWHRNVAQFAKVRYRKVYPGVDAVFYGNQSKLEYDFVVAPGADASQIAFDLDGVRAMHIDPSGNLVLSTAGGELVQHKPAVYQQIANRRLAVEGRYALRSGTRVGFELGTYDTHLPLVIDPMFGFSQSLGGTADDRLSSVAVDPEGNTYLTGWTHSVDLIAGGVPVEGSGTVLVTKLDAIGNLVYAAYLGGNADDTGGSIAVDAAGNAYIAGSACSTDFPVINAVQSHSGGNCDAFVTKLTPDGSALDYSTYVGGNGWDAYSDTDSFFGPYSVHVAVDGSGSAYITGSTTSTDFPVVNALQPTTTIQSPYGGTSDAYVVKLSPDGGSIVYSTYMGGSNADEGRGIAVDSSGNAYIVGETRSPDFPVVAAWQDTLGNADSTGYSDGFVAELSSDGATLVYSSYLGGGAIDVAQAIAVDAEGNAYVTGTTSSPEFPFSVFPAECPASQLPYYTERAFVAKIAPAGNGAVYSACLKGATPGAIAIDADGNAYVTGSTGSTGFPTATPMQPELNPNDYLPRDAFVSELAPDGATLLFSTYLGGNYLDGGTGIAVDQTGVIHVVGNTAATDFPTTNGSYSTEGPDAQPDTINNGFVATIRSGIELSIADVRFPEGNDTHQVSFNVHLSSPSPDPVTFDLDTVDIDGQPWTTTEGVDYQGVHARGLVIEPGQTDKVVTITIYGDTTPEPGDSMVYPSESFAIMPSNVVGATLRDLSALASIGNDDTVISIQDMAEPEGTGVWESYDMPIRLSAPVVVPVSFDYTVMDGSAKGSDYLVSPPQRTTLAPGMSGAGVGITLDGDVMVESDETILVGLSNVEGATVGQSAATFTILNDDTTLSIADASIVEGNSGTKLANFTVSLAQSTAVPVTFDVATQNGTASAGTDYTATQLTGVTIPAGGTRATVSVPVLGDTAIEANETFKVVVSNVAGATATDGTAVGTIRNDDTKLSIADISVVEGNSGSTLATFTIRLSNASAQPVTFNVATANKTAAAGTDYVARSLAGQSIAAGTTSRTFTVSILGDRAIEANETLLVNVSHVSGAVVADSQAIGTIRNDDTVFSIADVAATEGNSGTKLMTFTVKLSVASAAPVTFNILTTDKTAIAGSDYVARNLSGQVIAAGAMSKAFTVTLKGDTAREANETLLVSVGGVVGATVGDGQAIGTIVNDD